MKRQSDDGCRRGDKGPLIHWRMYLLINNKHLTVTINVFGTGNRVNLIEKVENLSKVGKRYGEFQNPSSTVHLVGSPGRVGPPGRRLTSLQKEINFSCDGGLVNMSAIGSFMYSTLKILSLTHSRTNICFSEICFVRDETRAFLADVTAA